MTKRRPGLTALDSFVQIFGRQSLGERTYHFGWFGGNRGSFERIAAKEIWKIVAISYRKWAGLCSLSQRMFFPLIDRITNDSDVKNCTENMYNRQEYTEPTYVLFFIMCS